MRILKALLSLALVADVAIASSNWISRAAYNKWHKNELEQWLDDHDIPHPAPADRKELQDIVQEHWRYHVLQPFHHWDSDQLAYYLQLKGLEVKVANEEARETLVNRVQEAWHETEAKAQSAYLNVKDWILDTWSTSQLKEFCDLNGIPVPQPRTRDVLLQKARLAYETAAKKQHQALGYPGNWLYDSWTDSDLKKWLDERGIPVPQPSKRDKLISSVRRNSYLAYLQAQDESYRIKKEAHNAFKNLQDTVLNTWSDSELKNFCDKNGINVPQGSKKNEIQALIRRRRAQILADTAPDNARSAFGSVVGAATSKAGNDYAWATSKVSEASQAAFDNAVDKWSESRLKAFLDARGVEIAEKRASIEQLRDMVRENAQQTVTDWSSWLDDLSVDDLRNYLRQSGDKAAKKIADKNNAVRADLEKAAKAAYISASKAGKDQYASATSQLNAATQSAKNTAFDNWSESDIKAYLDSYGIRVPQGSTLNEMRAYARKQATYFHYGTSSPTETLYAKAREGFSNAAESFWDSVDWALVQMHLRSGELRSEAQARRQKVLDEL